MVELARNNFSAPVNQKKKEVNKPDKFPSAATLTGFVIGLSTDIEKAFVQLGINPKHRNVLRFFYPEKGEEIVYRHCRVVLGVSSSPFLLAAVLAHLLENVPADDSQLGSKLNLSFSVDNCVTGVNDIAQQEEFILRSKEILSRGCFNLRNWESNVESKHISESTGTTKLLGIIWDIDEDTLKCKIDFESLVMGKQVAWVLRFLNNVRSRIRDRKKGQLSLDELQSAEIQLIRSVQAQRFTDEK
ncbi:uncharacterized protein TNCV_908221 [Trichonephila clavipes]|nr:uncharacterized protein TNCV_908221 [Trichonephila clavipes]